jgi:hypothetical protein
VVSPKSGLNDKRSAHRNVLNALDLQRVVNSV